MNLDKRYAIVTGAGRGIGLEIATFLAQKGFSIIITYRKSIQESELLIKKLKREYNIEGEALQISGNSPQMIKKLFQKYYDQGDQIDILVNNAGDYLKTPLKKLSIEEWRMMIEENLNIPYNWCHTFLKYAVKQNYGRIINIGYVNAGATVSKSLITPYYIAKSGLWHLTLAIAKSYASDQITANMISPGIMENSKTKPEIPPIGYYGSPKDLAHSLELLLSPSGAYITGTQINFCGGWGL